MAYTCAVPARHVPQRYQGIYRNLEQALKDAELCKSIAKAIASFGEGNCYEHAERGLRVGCHSLCSGQTSLLACQCSGLYLYLLQYQRVVEGTLAQQNEGFHLSSKANTDRCNRMGISHRQPTPGDVGTHRGDERGRETYLWVFTSVIIQAG